jgi:hypothetical protein
MIGEKEITGSFGCLKKGKKGNIGKSPRQPQRGLGVAQLEKIRLQRQIAEYIDPSMQSPFLGNIQKVCYYGFYDFCSFFREKNWPRYQIILTKRWDQTAKIFSVTIEIRSRKFYWFEIYLSKGSDHLIMYFDNEFQINMKKILKIERNL